MKQTIPREEGLRVKSCRSNASAINLNVRSRKVGKWENGEVGKW